MGTVTVSIADQTEEEFRRLAALKYGQRKGSLGKALTKALQSWVQNESKGAEAKTVEYLEQGFRMGKLKYKTRAELHER